MKLAGKWFICIASLLMGHISCAQVSFGNIALKGVTIIDAKHRVPLARQVVLIQGKFISDIFTDGSKAIPDSFTVINLTGKYLLPGLIDTHVHMATDPSGVDNRAHTLSSLEQMLYSGITTVRDMAGDARTLAGLSRDAMTGDIISPDIYYSALMAGPAFFNDPRTHTSARGAVAGKMPYMLGVTDSTDMTLAMAEAKGTGATGIKLYAYLPADIVRKIVLEANKQGMIVWGHAWLEPAKPTDMVNAGVSSISHAPLMVYDKLDSIPYAWKHQTHTPQFWDSVTPDLSRLFELMKQHHTILDATLLTYKQAGEHSLAWQCSYELGKRITAKAYQAGVTICAGTDDDQVEFVQSELNCLVKEAGLTPIDAIIAVTLNGARALQIDKQYGTIEPGKTADLLVLDKNPLQDIGNITSVNFVLKDGKVYKK
ncbi:MAG: amidohydrolase family protein [Bacteroidetes bacterium]|nr:amidohydrolase family protein [Bacteroidota bacterium]